MKALAKSFELSSCAALRVGPKIFMPRSRKISTIPAASGASGPTTVSVICSCCAKSASATGSVRATFFMRASSAVPPLPGATSTICMRLDCASFHASACSRPPEPTTRIFMKALGQVVVSALPHQACGGIKTFKQQAARFSRHIVHKCRSVFYYGIGINLLDIIEVFQRIEQLLHFHRIIAGEFGTC